jgi:anti-sigma28 factor (negative regulator of flagellin synthesis)
LGILDKPDSFPDHKNIRGSGDFCAWVDVPIHNCIYSNNLWILHARLQSSRIKRMGVDTSLNIRSTAGIGDGVVSLPALGTFPWQAVGRAKAGELPMSQVNNISQNAPVQKVVANPVQKSVPTGATPVRASDRLELSGASHLLAALKAGDVRTDKVAQIRQQIQDGTYDADGKKLDAAAGKLLDELAQG